MDMVIPKGLFDFDIQLDSIFSSYKITISNNRKMSAAVRGRLPHGIFPKSIDIIDNTTEKVIATIVGDNFFGVTSQINIMEHEKIRTVGKIKVVLSGIIFLFGEAIIVKNIENNSKLIFHSPTIVQQLKAKLPNQLESFPITYDNKNCGEFKADNGFFGSYSCPSISQIDQDNLCDYIGIIILASSLWLMRKLISDSG